MVPDPDPDSQRRWAGYQAEQLYSLVSHASRRGFTVTLIPEDAPSLVESSRIDALCFLDIRQDVPALLEALRLQLPVLTNDTADDRFRIIVDSGYVAFTLHALDLLAKRGAKRIGLLTEPLGFPSDESAEHTYLEWCTTHGQQPVIARGNHGHTNTAERVNDLLDAGCDAIYSFYEEGPVVMKAILDRSLHVPDDVQVVATTTPNLLSAESAGITSIVFHPELVAPAAFDAFLSTRADGTLSSGRIELPWEFLEARSTKD